MGIHRILSIGSVISFVISFYFDANENYKYAFLLPLGVLILNLLFQKHLVQLKYSIVFYLILFQVVVRYIILPPLVLTHGWFLAGFNSSNGAEAIVLMLLELLFVYITFSIISKKQMVAFLMKSTTQTLIKLNFTLIISLLLILFFITYSNYFIKVNFIWDLQTYVERIRNNTMEDNTNSLAGLIFPFLKIAVSLIIISYVITYRGFTKKTKIGFLFVILLMNSLLIVGMSRFSLFLTVLPLFVIILFTFYDFKRTLIIGALAILIPILMITSIMKFTWGDNKPVINDLISVNSLNSYFSGVGNVAAGIDSYEGLTEKSHINFFVNDILQNIPILSRYTNDQYKSNIYFNQKIYRHQLYQTQIVPLAIAGLYHFNTFGVFIYSFIFLIVAFYFERKFLYSRQIGIKYVYIFLAITLSLVFMLNIGSLVSTIVKSFFFYYVPLLVVHKLQNA